MCNFSSNCKKFKCGNCDENEFCIRKFKLEQYINISNLPPVSMLKLELYPSAEDVPMFDELKSVEEDIVNFVNSGKSLYICSEICGNGKTTWAYKLALSYINKMWKKSIIRPLVYFINVSDLLSMTKLSFESEDYAERVNNMRKYIQEADLVIWDDFAVRTLSEFDRDFILDLIDYRISHNKSNIYTSNNLGGITETKYGERLKSRVYNLSKKIILNGKDRRYCTE